MIYTKRLITIRNTTASIDAPVVLYRGDKEVEIIFEIMDSKFKFESSSGNLINNSHAAYGQMVIACPNGSNTISNVMKCENGLITFVMTASMMDELTEIGTYSFHIRLYNDTRTSRITLPPVMEGIEVREPLVKDDDVEDDDVEDTDLVGVATIGYSMIQTYGAEEPAFDESGNYIKTDWQIGDKITASKLNKIEETLDTINNDIPFKTSELVNDSNFLTNIPSEYITETELNAKGYSTFNGDYDNLTNKPTIPSISGLASESYVNEYVENAIKDIPKEEVDLSDYAKKTELPTKLSQLANDEGYITSIPSEYVTESELNSKGYLTEHQNLSDYAKIADIPTKTSQLTNDNNFLTSVPSEYVTESELNAKGYLTEHQDISSKADKSEIPTKTSQLNNDSNFLTNIPSEYVTESELNAKGYLTSVPSEYITDNELNAKGYLTQHQDISHLAEKSELHNHSNKLVLDGITSDKVTSWDNKSNFDGNYNSLTNKPSIPSIEGLTTKEYVDEEIKNIDLTGYVKTVNGVTPNEKGNVTISATLEPPTVVDSIEEMLDTNKQYVLSTDGFIYAYKQGEEVTTPNFTNLADTGSSDWLTGSRLSTSSTSSASGAYVTNYIPCKLNDIIRIKGMHIDYYSSSTAHKSRFHVLNSSKALVVGDCGYITGLIESGHASSDGDITTVTAGYAGATSTAVNGYSATAYERFCGYLIDGYALDDVIITVNEEITYTTVGGYAWTSTGISYTSADYSVVIQEIQNDIDNLEATISNLGDTSIPSYWVEELNNKVDNIQQIMESIGRNKSSFLWYTDAHWQSNAKNSPILLDYLIKNTPINKVNFGGDIVGDPSPYDHTNIKSFYGWQKAIANIPNHHSVYGNHDLNHWTTDVHKIAYALVLAHEESNDMIVSDIDGCYYIDYPSEKTRYLYLCYLTKNQTDMMAQGQFIVDSIKSVKEGWHIVAIAHRWFQYASSSTPTTGSIPAYETDILDVFDKYNARATKTGSNYFYAQDFTDCVGRVEFCIGGHIHVDYDFTSPGGIPIIITASDANQERANGEDEDCGTVGTITEQAIYAIVADYEGGKINIIGIGRGGSREVSLDKNS